MATYIGKKVYRMNSKCTFAGDYRMYTVKELIEEQHKSMKRYMDVIGLKFSKPVQEAIIKACKKN